MGKTEHEEEATKENKEAKKEKKEKEGKKGEKETDKGDKGPDKGEGKDKKAKKDKEPKDKKGEKDKPDKKEKKDKEPTEGKDKASKEEKIRAKISVLEQKLGALGAHEKSKPNTNSTNIFGIDLRSNKDVRITLGPVIGKVTSTSAVVLLEITLTAEITVHLVPKSGPTAEVPSVTATQLVRKNRPKAFLVEKLVSSTSYNVVFEGVNAKDAGLRVGVVRTFPENPAELRVVALSCNKPERMRNGETNMWHKLAEEVLAGEVDVVLHLGDQVYGQDEFLDAQAMLRFSTTVSKDPQTEEEKKNLYKLHKAIRNHMRNAYRLNWNLPGTKTVLSHCSNLMIWSDNDLFNDFTIAKQDGDCLEPQVLHLGQMVYREFQRQLSNVNVEAQLSCDEFHYHKWGSFGIFMIDMKGNRITVDGKQRPENNLLNDRQWALFQEALGDPALKNFFVCAEIPFATDPPEVVKANALKHGTEFLVDHWGYHDAELVRLLEAVFDWKNEKKDERDAIFLGGDIHVGVTSKIKDSKTGIELVQLTTTPISNHVCDFYPKLEGVINERFSYSHVPLKNCRNFAYIITQATGHIEGKLIPGAPTSHS